MLLMILCSGQLLLAQNDKVQMQSIKFDYFLRMLDAVYVDTVNVEQLTELAIVRTLQSMDPHSVYISREEVQEANESLEGGFFGIGIQFSILRDTLIVVDVIAGGPSERVGLLPGDRIVGIDGEYIIGIGLTNTEVRKRLKGEEGSKVQVTVLRGEDTIEFSIIRGMIPINSVDASYMIDDRIGYIKVARFASTTIEEFDTALSQLKMAGMKDLIIDLQGNGGGFMHAARGLADHLLSGRKLVVYMDGRNGRMEELYSTPAGLFQEGRVVILQDSYSASASEILAGAVQDWDRGVIVGRRSFAKGLVQRQFPLPDGSEIRLTIAHYFTPSGRNIQKPYKGENYQVELYDRYQSGEMYTQDSIHLTDTTSYFTKEKRRVVYGGGGIIPDIFVPLDTTVNYLYFNQLLAKNVIQEYQLNYVDKNRNNLKRQYPQFETYRRDFKVSDQMVEEIVRKGEKQGVARNEKTLLLLRDEIKRYLKALIARDIWGLNELYMLTNEDNPVLQAGIKTLRDGSYETILK